MGHVDENLLFKKRLEKNLTQEALAVLLNCDRTTISGWEQGLRKPCADLLLPAAEKLGVSASELYASIYQKWSSRHTRRKGEPYNPQNRINRKKEVKNVP